MKPRTPQKKYLRSDVSRGISEGVDREADVVRGYSVISKGMARGHNLEIDDETLDQVVKLGNRTRGGVKSRFGHPSMSSESLGTFLGRAKKFRRDGDLVRADLHVDPTAHETPNGDLAKYVVDLAESDPGAFGSSIVFTGEPAYRLEEDGTRQKNKKTGEDLPPLARVEELHASDVVDDPAANDGMFSVQFMTPDCELSAKASEFLESFLADPRAVEKAMSFLQRFAAEKDSTEGGHEMSTKIETPEASAGTQPEKAERGEGVSKEEIQAQLAEARKSGIAEERRRISEIRESAFSGQEALIQKAIDEGLSVADAQKAFIAERKTRDGKALETLRTDPAPDLGPNLEAKETKPASEPEGEDALRKKWEADPELRREFSDFEVFAAFSRAKASGKYKVPEKIVVD